MIISPSFFAARSPEIDLHPNEPAMRPGITWESPQCGVDGQGDMAKVENGSRLFPCRWSEKGQKASSPSRPRDVRCPAVKLEPRLSSSNPAGVRGDAKTAVPSLAHLGEGSQSRASGGKAAGFVFPFSLGAP